MIIRILGEGQLDVDDSLAGEMLERVRSAGTPVPADSFESSDVILPYSDASMDDVRGLLSEDGLIPG
jgi:hypothetical protein